MSRRILDLSTLAWRFGRAPRQPWGQSPVDDRAQVPEWLPARVPGDVRADLMAVGQIPSVATPEGIAAGEWVDDWDWWYQVELPGGNSAAEQVFLQADGIDFYSAIWLDGRLLATHAGMFARQSMALSPHINLPGSHVLAIRVWGGGVFAGLPERLSRRALRKAASMLPLESGYFTERMTTTKAQFSFGWDFAPRLLSTGIWDEARLVTVRGVYIEDLWVRGEPLTAMEDPTPAHWHLRIRLHRWQSGPMQVEISLAPENFGEAGYQTLTRTVDLCPEYCPPCAEDYEFELDTAAARRWWPWDQGDACLYRVTVRLCDAAGLLDEVSCTAAVRSVSRESLPGKPLPGKLEADRTGLDTVRDAARFPKSATGAGSAPDRSGRAWQFVVNGRPVFLRGANWVPADVLPGRLTDADYERLLAMARNAGINFLRVWGGGLREKRAFWDLCDRLGIMAWQEFPLACDFLDNYTRKAEYLSLLSAETKGIVEALRNHPSLIAWCGGNEISPARERLQLGQIADVLKQHDPTRPWIPTSPGPGDIHQWDVWHALAPWTELAREKASFISEFGLQALPSAETLSEMFPSGRPGSLTDPRWPKRKAQVSKLLHYGGPAAHGTLREAIEITQRVQATALQVGLEAARLRRPSYGLAREDTFGPTCAGVAFWQFNEPWPAVSWSVVDRAGRPKAAYEMLCRSYQPLLIAAVFPWRTYQAGESFTADVWLVNDGLDACEDCCAEAELDGKPVWALDAVTVFPASVKHLGRISCDLTAGPQALGLRVTEEHLLLAANRYDLAVPLPPARPLQAKLRHSLIDRFLK